MLLPCGLVAKTHSENVKSRSPLQKDYRNDLPHFASLRSDRTNLRVGPGKQYKILWHLQTVGLPVQLIMLSDNWWKVKTHDNTEGWIHKALIAKLRTVIVIDSNGELREEPNEMSRLLVKVSSGVVLSLRSCQDYWCQVEYSSKDQEEQRGWIQQEALFGTYRGETISYSLFQKILGK